MKYINLIFGILLLWSCSPDDVEVISLTVNPEDITRIELRADHKTLLPNGIAKMEFYVKAYSTKDFLSYTDVHRQDTAYYNEDSIRMEYEIPEDLIPEGYLKVYGPDGKILDNNIYSTTEPSVRTLSFHAEANGLKSNELKITIRELPDESYPEVVYPVIFHIIIPPTSAGPSYSLSTEFLQAKLDRVNDIFNRHVTTDPNGGNAKIKFKLAEFDKNGMPLTEKGKEEIQLSSALSSKNDYVNYIEKNLIWDPNKYLNVWVAKFEASISDKGSYTYQAAPPDVILRGSEPIPGLEAEEVDGFSIRDVEDYRQAGFMVNYHEFLNPNAGFNNSFEVGTAFATYLGLILTQMNGYVDTFYDTGDSDYCPDTYVYSPYRKVIYKDNILSDYDDEVFVDQVEYFTSFNVMDSYSRKNSISADQAARMRAIVDRCPSRWSYKSKWAFTGKN